MKHETARSQRWKRVGTIWDTIWDTIGDIYVVGNVPCGIHSLYMMHWNKIKNKNV